jgi:hypothetical protein
MGNHNQDIDISEKFEFTSKEKFTLIGLMVLGVVCLGLSYYDGGLGSEDHHLRFWTNFLHNTVFFTGIAFISMFLLAAKVLAYSGWHTVWKRLLEAKAQFLIFGLLGMILVWLGSQMGWHNLYHWNFPGIGDAAPGTECYDRIISGKAGFLNSSFYLGATVVFGGIWYACILAYRKLSLSEDISGDESYAHHKKMKVVSAIYMPVGGFTSAGLIWLWVMSIDSHWYSTMFAWYATASWLVSCVALLILTIIYLQSRGYFSYVTGEHIHDLGKYLFGFSIFWTYLWFSQFMLIWYANNGEETIYFDERMLNFPLLFWANLVMNFALPLLILVRNDAKRKYGILTLVCCICLFGHWWDFFQMIKPGALHSEHAYHEYMDKGCGEDTSHDETLGQNDESYKSYAKLASFQDDDAKKEAHGHEGEGHSHEDAAAHDEHAQEGHGHDNHKSAHHGEEHENGTAGHGQEGHAAAEHGGEGHEAHGEEEHGHDDHAHGPAFRMGFTIPGLLEIGIFFGFLASFFFVVFTSLSKAALVPANDPYLGESLHHHVGYGGGNMEGDDEHH